jgi:hypothetical protein
MIAPCHEMKSMIRPWAAFVSGRPAFFLLEKTLPAIGQPDRIPGGVKSFKNCVPDGAA